MDQKTKTIDFKNDWTSLGLPAHIMEVLSAAPALYVAESREDLLNWALGREAGATDWSHSNREDKGEYEAAFEVPGIGRVAEAIDEFEPEVTFIDATGMGWGVVDRLRQMGYKNPEEVFLASVSQAGKLSCFAMKEGK